MKTIKYTLLIFCVFSLNALSQQKEEQSGNVEVIEVLGATPIGVMRKELRAKRFAVMDFFNANIEVDDLKFECRRESQFRSRIKKDVCQNVYDIRIQQERFIEALLLGREPALATNLSQTKTLESERFDKEKIAVFNKMLVENEEFLQIYTDFKTAQAKFEKARQMKFGESNNSEEESN